MEIIDAQIIYHSRQAMPDHDFEGPLREEIAVDLAVASMDAVGVDRALWHGERSISETAVKRHPNRFQAMVYYDDPEVPDVEGILSQLRTVPGLLGIRLTPAWPPSGENIERLVAGAYEPWFAAAERHAVPIALFMSGGLSHVPGIAEGHPDLRLLIDHVGMMPAPHVPLTRDVLNSLPELLRLAKYPNVAVKFTGVPALSFEPYPFRDLWPACHRMLEAFGADRMMWGSDFMRLKSLHSYAEVVDFLKLSDEVSESDKELLFSRSLRRWVGWPEDTSR